MLDSGTPISSLPHKLDRVALYFNGHVGNLNGNVPEGREWERVYWIDVLGAAPLQCSILDIETGDASPQTIRQWVPARLKEHPGYLCRLYNNLSTWRTSLSFARELSSGEQKQVRWWVADPTMKKHVVSGSAATQWYWGNMDSPPVNFDRSEVTPEWDN